MSNDKYDRQTRLWGEGQILICNARLLSFNSDCCTTEILKNLILAGIGQVIIVDDKIVDSNDLNENFFLNQKDLGRKRGAACLDNLLELNPDSKGEYIDSSVKDFCEKNLSLFRTFDIVVSSNLDLQTNLLLNQLVDQFQQRLVIVKNYGLINYMRIYENFHGNMQLKLHDKPIVDLRLVKPWKELKDHCLSINLDQLNPAEHKHIPYIIILMQALENFKENNNGNLPNKTAEFNHFKQIISSMQHNNDEENFNEAKTYYFHGKKERLNELTPEVEEIFDLLKSSSLNDLLRKSNQIMSTFFSVWKAIHIFYEKYKTMPVIGDIPDMTSDTVSFITLKKIYQEKAILDRQEVKRLLLTSVLGELDISNNLKKEFIINSLNSDVNYLDIICKNWQQTNLLSFTNLQSELNSPSFNDNCFFEEKDQINFKWYLLIQASEVFYKDFNRYPGQNLPNDKFSDDIEKLKGSLEVYIKTVDNVPDFGQSISDDFFYEFCRFSNSKIIPAVSIIGSLVSQEIIKLITYKFNTINNTVIFDGIHNVMTVFKF